MVTADAPISIPSNLVTKRLLAEQAFRRGCSASELVRQAIDRSASTAAINLNGIDKPYLAARLTVGQQQHLKKYAQQAGVSHSQALEAMLCDFLFDPEATAPEAADEPDLFD